MIETGIVDHERCVTDKGEEFIDDLDKPPVAFQKLGGKSVDCESLGRHIAFGIEIDVEGRSGRYPVEQLNAPELDETMPLGRIKAGSFGIENNFAHIVSVGRITVAVSAL